VSRSEFDEDYLSMPIDRPEAMRLLADAGYGRVIFTRDALPAIRTVNHLVDEGVIIVRTRLNFRPVSIALAKPEIVVAYQADDVDPVRRTGWSVVVTGVARTVTDPERIARYENMLQPWLDEFTDSMVEIESTIVSGVRFNGLTP
jgi:hypothetical protein